jgi:uncharacterized protein with GYD domain
MVGGHRGADDMRDRVRPLGHGRAYHAFRHDRCDVHLNAVEDVGLYDNVVQEGSMGMALYMYQVAYTAESLAAQLKNPANRAEMVGRAACEAVGGQLVGHWYCFGEYDLVIIADVPDNISMTAISLAIAAGGAVKSAKTTVLMSGADAVAGMKKADAVAKVYTPAR